MPQREAFVLAGANVGPGTRQTVDIPVSVLADHTGITMSAHVIHGARTGPTAFVSAAVHGDEIIGVEIVRRLLAQLDPAALRGTLIAVPIVNAYGLLALSRYLPDRRDLNRSFPGSPKGSLAARLANIFMNEIVLRCDFGVDLHSAAVHRHNLPQVRVSRGNDTTAHLAGVFGAPVVLKSTVRDGSLRAAAEANGVDVLLYEAGEALRFDEVSVRTGVAGVLRVLNQRKMIGRKGVSRPRTAPITCPSSEWIRAPQGGLLRLARTDGDVVQKGESLGTVADPFGENEAPIVAPRAGVIVGRTVLPIVNEGDPVFHIGHVDDTEGAEDVVERFTSEFEDT